MSARLRRVALRLGFLAVAGVVLVGVAEVAIRVLDLFREERAALGEKIAREPGPRRKGMGAASKFQVHPFVGWSRRPGVPLGMSEQGIERLFPEGKATDWWIENNRSNLFGFRSGIDDYRRVADDRFVIGIFGGSVATGLALLGGEALDLALGERRPELAGRIAVLNFGFGGYKQPQQVNLLVEMLMLGLRFDAVVNIDGFNEVALGGQDAAAGHHPLFPSRAHYRSTVDLARGAPTEGFVELSAAVVGARREARALAETFGTSRLLGASETAKAIAGRLVLHRRRQAVEGERRLQELSEGPEAESILVELPDPCLGGTEGCWDLIAGLWQRGSLLMSALAQTTGATYLHVLQPNQYVEGSKPLTAEERERFWDPTHKWARGVVVGYPYLRRKGEELQAEGVAFHDLTGIFSTEERTIYRDRCCHYNLTGNEILARAIADLIARNDRGADPPAGGDARLAPRPSRP